MTTKSDATPAVPPPSPCSAYLEVSRDDLRILTSAILDSIGEWQNSGPWQAEQMHCRYCGEVLHNERDLTIGHSLDCPVQVAISCKPNITMSHPHKPEGEA